MWIEPNVGNQVGPVSALSSYECVETESKLFQDYPRTSGEAIRGRIVAQGSRDDWAE